MKQREKGGFYEFDSFRLAAGERVLWRAGKLVALTPKEFELLVVLVEAAGRVVGKDELLEEIWKDTFVEEGTLTRNISWLRKKLAAEDATATAFIETLPKRGYRFLPAVTKIEDAPAPVAFVLAAPTLIIEDQTLTRIRIEEIVTLETPEEATKNLDGDSPRPLPPAPLKPSRPVWLWLALGVAATIGASVICLALYQNFFRKAEPKIVVLSPATPFSGLPGRENFPSVSHDGKQLTFVWNNGDAENFDVYVRLIGAGEPVRLTDTQEDEIHPTFSPDGSHVAFVRPYARGSAVFLVPALGGAERKICDLFPTSSRLSFTPDGKSLAVIDAEEADKREGVFLVDVATRAKRRLTAPPESAKDFAVRVSPDGSQVAYDAQVNGNGEIFTVSVEGGAPRRLTTDAAQDILPAWSHDGRLIYFCSNRNGSYEIWKMEREGGAAVQVTKRGGFESALTFDGKEIYYTKERGDGRVWRASLEGGEESLVTELAEAGSWRYWTMTRTGIYFVPRASSAPYRVRFYDFASRAVREMATTESAPIWVYPGLSASADGKTILYAQHDQNASSIMLAEF